jgi:hypothetical protein
MGLFDTIKDHAIQAALNQLLGDIGALSGLAIDRQQQRLTATLTLQGEERAIAVKVTGWTLADAAHPSAIRIAKASTDRVWLTAILQRLVVGRWITVTPDYLKKISLALG